MVVKIATRIMSSVFVDDATHTGLVKQNSKMVANWRKKTHGRWSLRNVDWLLIDANGRVDAVFSESVRPEGHASPEDFTG